MPNEECIQMLRDVLALAEAGTITGAGVITVDDTSWVNTTFHGDPDLLIVGARVLERRLLSVTT